MQMYMKEPYVSFKIAKLLKEKGFDWFTFGYYTMDDYDSPPYFGIENLCADNWNGEVDEVNDFWFSAPTQQMACRWLREKKSVWVTHRPLDYDHGVDGLAYIKTPDNEWLCAYTCTKDSVEDAIETALEYALANLI